MVVILNEVKNLLFSSRLPTTFLPPVAEEILRFAQNDRGGGIRMGNG